MIHRSPTSNSFEFVAIACLRTHQLRRGCIPRVAGNHKATTLALMEVVAGQVSRLVTKMPSETSQAAPDPAIV